MVAAGRNPFSVRECLHCIVESHFTKEINHVSCMDNRKTVLACVGNQPLVVEHRPWKLPVSELGELCLLLVIAAVGQYKMAV